MRGYVIYSLWAYPEANNHISMGCLKISSLFSAWWDWQGRLSLKKYDKHCFSPFCSFVLFCVFGIYFFLIHQPNFLDLRVLTSIHMFNNRIKMLREVHLRFSNKWNYRYKLMLSVKCEDYVTHLCFSYSACISSNYTTWLPSPDQLKTYCAMGPRHTPLSRCKSQCTKNLKRNHKVPP